jgi:hypothetical protein
MELEIQRDGMLVARMEVMQRFTARDVVVARLTEQLATAAPAAGDVASGR